MKYCCVKNIMIQSIPTQVSPITFTRYFLPGIWWIHKRCILDLVIYVLIFIKWECTTKAHIDDDSHWPHIQRSIVALAPKNLWSKISRGSHNRSPEGLLSNNACKTKITELHLKKKKCVSLKAHRNPQKLPFHYNFLHTHTMCNPYMHNAITDII